MKYRTKEIKIRLTEQEHQKLLDRKNGALATWIRETCLDEKPRKPIKRADPELLRQLAKIGANLNQVAKVANTQEAKGEIIDSLKILGELAIIREQLTEILKQHDSEIF